MKKILLSLIFCLVVSPAFAATYYFDSTYTGTYSGTFAEPYKTSTHLTTVISNLATSDKIYLKAGSTFTWGAKTFTTSGVDGDPFTVGAYYDNAGSPAYDTAGVISNGGKPIIDGEWDGTLGSTTCESDYTMALYFTGDWVKVENIKITDWKGIGIRIRYGDYGVISNVETHTTLRSGISVYDLANSTTVTECTIEYASKIGRADLGKSLGCNWPAAISITMSKYAQVDNNTVVNNYGEGIGLFTNTSNSSKQTEGCTVENNTVVGAWAAGIYPANSKDNIIRYNMVLGTTNTDFHRYTGGFVGHGLLDANESLGGGINLSSGNEFYGNFVAYTIGGFAVGGSDTVGNITGVKVWNNTFISNRYNLTSWAAGSANNHSGIDFRNNIAFCLSDDLCSPTSNLKSAWFSALSHNYWSSYPGADYVGTDSIYTDTTLPTFKTTGWQSFTSAVGTPVVTDFQQTDGAQTINAGTDLGNAPYHLDYWDTNRDTNTPWDIGAHEYTESTPGVPGVDAITSMCAVAPDDDTWACISAPLTVLRGQKLRLKLTFGAGQWSASGQLLNIAIPMALNAGDSLVFQPTGYGVGTEYWGFESQPVEGDMELMATANNLQAAAVGAMDRDYVTTGSSTVIINAADEELSSYDLPQVTIDPTYKVRIDGVTQWRIVP